MKIYVTSILGLGLKLEIEADENDTIKRIKNQVFLKLILPSDSSNVSMLIKDDMILRDKASLKECGIKENDTLSLVPKHVNIASKNFLNKLSGKRWDDATRNH
ncbi:MAG: hypothetical protein JW840_09490 [Candidatus Thermoplasmatota archaeon]|nr:hypothetical protein [Candidatus Thermoplasmatota archaeon]